jgi:hypothetical protein
MRVGEARLSDRHVTEGSLWMAVPGGAFTKLPLKSMQTQKKLKSLKSYRH